MSRLKNIFKIKKVQKPTPKTKKRPPKNTKNLNRGTYDKFEENIPSPTFTVDYKTDLRNSQSQNANSKITPKIPTTTKMVIYMREEKMKIYL